MMLGVNSIYNINCIAGLKQLQDCSINCCVTSPPYWGLRDYGVAGQLGLEKTPEEYVENLTAVFQEVKRVLRDDGTLWLNLGDSYSGSGKGRNADGTHSEGGKQATNFGAVDGELYKTQSCEIAPKNLVGIPWRVAFALQADGWYLRQDIIWHKTNPMPESVTDRCTKSHEYIFLLSKSPKYYYDAEAIAERTATKDNSLRNRDITKLNNCPGRTKMGGLVSNNYETRNKRSVWTVSTARLSEAHFATFPPELIEPCILAGCPKDGIVLDPFMGSGTTALVAYKWERNFIGFELNQEYCDMANRRIREETAQVRMKI